MTKLFKILHVGHSGVGGIFGMSTKGNEQNEYQRWLRKCWNKTKKRIGIPQVLIIGGEIIEGYNKKGFAEDIWLSRVEDQMMMAIELIEEWIDPKITQEVIILYGHQYHSIREMRLERLIAELIEARTGVSCSSGKLIHREYFGKIFRFWHGSSGAFVYKASSKERQIKFNLQAMAMGKTPRFDRLYTYHTHELYSAQLESVKAISCPCFKLIDSWPELKHPDGWLPTIGVLVTTFEERFGEIQVNDDAITFIPPFRFEELENAKNKHSPKAKIAWKKVKMAIGYPYKKELEDQWKKM